MRGLVERASLKNGTPRAADNAYQQGNNIMKLSVRIAAVLLAGTAITAANAEDADPIKIGFIMPYSGWFQPVDATTINGAMLAVKELNQGGGVLGRQLEVLAFDNKSEPPLGADGTVEVIEQGARMILFPSDFDFGAPGAFIAQQEGVIAMAGASDPKFGVQGIGPYAYSMSTAAQAQGALLAEWAYETQGWRKPYVLLDNTISFTRSLCSGFTDRWKDLAGEATLLGEDTFLNSDPSIAAQASRITGLSDAPDFLLLCSYPPGGPSAIRQLRGAGIDQPILGGEPLDGDFWAGTVPNLSNFYATGYGSFLGDDPDPEVNSFFQRYEAEYGQRADSSYPLRGYSIIQAWARAVERAGSLEAAAVAAVLDTFTDEPLVIGPTTYTSQLHIQTTRPMTIIQVQNGVFSAVGKFAAKSVRLD